MNITSLGAFNDSNNDQAYYLQSGSAGYVPTSSIYVGELNEPFLIYQSESLDTGIQNYRDFYTVYLREQGKTYGIYDLNTEQNIPILTYRKYALPLSNQADLKITVVDDIITGSAPYTGMSISYTTSSVTRDIGGIFYPFKVIIDGNNGTAEQIYQFVQYQLRQPTDIDINDNLTTVRGDTAEDLLLFIGDTLQTNTTTVDGLPGGTFIDNFQAADTNRLQFNDDSGSLRTFPFVAAGTLNFNDNLQNDIDGRYFAFFTNDNAGDNSGSDFGTDAAVVINQNSGAPISGSINASSSLGFDYDYDNNTQRGAASSGSDVPYTAVSLGLTTAQYVVTTGTLTRSTANIISFVAALERNYLNPA